MGPWVIGGLVLIVGQGFVIGYGIKRIRSLGMFTEAVRDNTIAKRENTAALYAKIAIGDEIVSLMKRSPRDPPPDDPEAAIKADLLTRYLNTDRYTA